jgi:hypothetical protein
LQVKKKESLLLNNNECKIPKRNESLPNIQEGNNLVFPQGEEQGLKIDDDFSVK